MLMKRLNPLKYGIKKIDINDSINALNDSLGHCVNGGELDNLDEKFKLKIK